MFSFLLLLLFTISGILLRRWASTLWYAFSQLSSSPVVIDGIDDLEYLLGKTKMAQWRFAVKNMRKRSLSYISYC